MVIEEVALNQNMSTVTLPVQSDESHTSRAHSGLPQTQTVACDEAPPPATQSLSMGGSTPLFSVTLEMDSNGLEEVPSTSVQADTAVEIGPFKPQDDQTASYPLMSKKVEAQAEIQEDETPMEIGLLAPTLEEQIVFDSACMNQLPIPIITIQAENTMVSDSMDIDYTPLIRTMNIEDLSTVTPVDSSERGDFKMQQGGIADAVKSRQDCNLSVSTMSALERNEDIVPLQEGLTSAFEKKKEVNSNLKTEELPLSEIESDEKTRETSVRNEGQTLTIESEFGRGKEGEAVVEVQADLNKSLSLPGARNEDVTVRLSDEAAVVNNPDDTGSQLFVDNLPENETFNSAFEDTTDIKAIIPQIVSNGNIIKTANEVKEPEIKEPMVPLITLPSITEPQILQKDLKANMSILKDNNTILVSNTDSLLHTCLQNEDKNPPTDKTQEVVQLDDKTEIQHTEPQPSEHVPRVDIVSIPAINVSYTDENELRVDVPVCVPETAPVLNAQVNEAPKVPLLVVPPISIICDDIPVETISVSSQHQHTLTGPNQGGETHVESHIAVESPSQGHILNGALTPADVTTNMLSLIKATEGIGDSVTCKKKIIREVEKEPDAPDVHVKDLEPDKLPVERLDVKAHPTHAALSPASLRRFLSRAGPRSDSPTAMAVPAITVGDSQSDKTGEELSGGSTPTSSLSCESSPRLKRRDSLSLIRSATPEELASGARRKIFMPRVKGEDGGEGVGLGVSGVPEAVKRETPYMSPSQARRASLLQAPTGQNTPPMERRSPLLNRRKATLEVPKVVEEKPAEEPDKNKSEDKPVEKEKLDPFKGKQKEIHLNHNKKPSE